VIDQILTDRVVLVHRKRDLQLCADTVDARHENRPSDTAKICAIECAERSNVGENIARERGSDILPDPPDKLLARLYVNSRILVRLRRHHQDSKSAFSRYLFFFM
jgi:hypothetical protein